MSENIGKIPSSQPGDKKSQNLNYGWDLKFYSSELFKRFLISKNTPESSKEIEEIEKISKNLSLLLWIGKAQILNEKEESKVIEEIKELTENFHQNDLFEKTTYLIQTIKNLSPKTDILELFTDIECKACLSKEKRGSISQEELHSLFEKIIEIMNHKKDKFSLLKLERELKEVKKIYFDDPTQVSLLIYNLNQITRL